MSNTTIKSRSHGCLPIIKQKKIPSNSIQIHLSDQSVDTDFFNFYNFTNNDKIIFLSYNFNDKQLAEKFDMLEDYTIENRIENKDPLNDLEQYKNQKYNGYEIIIEGIDFLYISQNFDKILSDFRKVRNDTVKYHFNIVNVPNDKKKEFRDMINNKVFLTKKHKPRKWND